MRTPTRTPMRATAIVLAAFCGLAAAPAAGAFPGAAAAIVYAQADERNAALEYWRLITVEHGGEELRGQVADALQAMHPGEDAEHPPIDEPASLKPGGALAIRLAELGGYLNDAERATRTPVCDFQIRYEDGYAVLMPHLGPLRGIARMMVADARRLALAGETEAAAGRLAAVLRLGRHVSSDRTVISSLVSVAITDAAIDEGRWLLERTANDPAVRRALAGGVARFPQHDPYNMEGALQVERDMVEVLARQFRGPRAGRDFLDAFGPAAAPDGDANTRAVAGMDARAFKAETERAVDAFDLILEAWRGEDAGAELSKIERRCEAGDFGVVASLVMPALGNAQARDARARAELEAFRSLVNGDG